MTRPCQARNKKITTEIRNCVDSADDWDEGCKWLYYRLSNRHPMLLSVDLGYVSYGITIANETHKM